MPDRYTSFVRQCANGGLTEAILMIIYTVTILSL